MSVIVGCAHYYLVTLYWPAANITFSYVGPAAPHNGLHQILLRNGFRVWGRGYAPTLGLGVSQIILHLGLRPRGCDNN